MAYLIVVYDLYGVDKTKNSKGEGEGGMEESFRVGVKKR